MKNKRDFCISTVRKILQEKHITFKEIEADSGSIYFRFYLYCIMKMIICQQYIFYKGLNEFFGIYLGLMKNEFFIRNSI